MKVLCGLVRRMKVDLGRSCRVEPLRSETVDGSQPARSPSGEAGGISLGDQGHFGSIGAPSEIDFGSGDFDIGAVIASFNSAPTISASQLLDEALQQGASKGMLLGHAGCRPEDDGINLYGEHFDPVFGIDALLSRASANALAFTYREEEHVS